MSAGRAPSRQVPGAAAWLGGLGLAPFVAGAAAAWLLEEPRRGAALFLLAAHAAVVLSFLGAVHWGLALAGATARPARAMTLSVLPALLAWLTLSLPVPAALVLMGAGFLCTCALDVRASSRGEAPAWYPRLRLPLTAAVLLCLAGAVGGILAHPYAPPAATARIAP